MGGNGGVGMEEWYREKVKKNTYMPDHQARYTYTQHCTHTYIHTHIHTHTHTYTHTHIHTYTQYTAHLNRPQRTGYNVTI